jgi:putative transposase
MTLAVNAVIQWEESDVKFERILWLDWKNNFAVVFPLDSGIYESALPEYRSISEIEEAISLNLATKRTVDPYARIVTTEFIKDHSETRDKAWKRIRDIVTDEPDIFDSKLRGKLVEQAIENHNTTKKTLYKSMRKYWRYGKTENALLPLYDNCGAPGEKREITNEMIQNAVKAGEPIPKRGRPVIGSDKNPELIGINLTKTDKENIEKALKQYYETTIKPTFKEAHQYLLDNYYTVFDKNDREIIDPSGRYPSLWQVKTYFYENHDLRKTLIKREGEKGYNLRHRPVLGYTTQNPQMGPGSVYQLDSTITGVHLVSRFNPNRMIGKAVVYYVMDVLTRFIKGFHVGLGNSWEEAKFALLDAFLDQEQKSNSTDEFGEICYLPQAIYTDRGTELIGYNSDSIIASFGIRVTNTPPYRADWKPEVEQQFNQLRQKIRDIPGFVKKGHKERGEKDHREEAILDIEDFTAIVREIIEDHNFHNYMENYPREEAMILDGVEPYPINLWEWGVENKRGAFNQVSTDLAIINLLPRGKGTITEYGLRFENRYYSSNHALKENWFLRSSPSQGKHVEIAFDYRHPDTIYLFLDKGKRIEKCNLMPRSKKFTDYRVEEIRDFMIEDKEKANLKKKVRHQTNKNRNDKIKEIVLNAERKTAEAQKNNTKSKTKQFAELNKNRSKEKEAIREELSQKIQSELNMDFHDDHSSVSTKEALPQKNYDNDDGLILSKQKSYQNKLKEWKKKRRI